MKKTKSSSKMRWILPVVALVVVGGGGAVAYKVLSTPDFLVVGQEQITKGDYRAALISLRNAVRDDPNNPQARAALADVSLRLGDVLTADKEIRRAVELGLRNAKTIDLLGRILAITDKIGDLNDNLVGPQDDKSLQAVAMAWRGYSHMRHRRLDEAQKSFDQALALDPSLARAHLGLAQLNLGLGKRDLTLAAVEGVLSRNPQDAEALALRGELKRLGNDKEGAKKDFAEAIRLDPSNVGARVAFASLLLDENKLDEARTEVVAALRLSPAHAVANNLYALGAFKKGEFNDGIERLEKLGDRVQDYPPNLYMLALLKMRTNQAAQAESLLEKFVAAAPGHIRARILLADLLSKRQNYTRAIALLRPLVDGDKVVPEAAISLASAYIGTGNTVEAKAAYEKAASATGSADADVRTKLRIGLGRMQLGESDKAIDDIEAAIDIDDKSAPARTALALALLRRGETAKALESAEALRALEPDKPGPFLLIGTIQIVAGDWEKARAALAEAQRLAPTAPNAPMTVSMLDLQEGYGERALEGYKKVLETSPTLGQAALAAGNIELARTNEDAALAYYEKAYLQDTTMEAAGAQIVNAMLRRGNKERALQIAREMLAKRPGSQVSIRAMALAQFAMDDKSGANATLRQLLAANPKSPEAHMAVASAMIQQGDKAAAAAMYKDALAAKADYTPALLARMAIDISEGRLADAQSAATVFVNATKSPRSVAELTALANFQAGKSQEAVSQLKELIRTKKASPTAERDLASAYLAVGDTKAGIDILEQMQAKTPSDLSLRMALGDAWIREGTLAKAATQYEALLPTAPRNPVILNNLAWIYAKAKDPRALKFAEDANRAAPNSREIQDTLGQQLVDSSTPQAVERGVWLLRLARANGLGSADTALGLARGLVKLKQNDQAKPLLTAVAANGNADEKARANELLKQIQ
jgi:putative PEP-CTERM system TPR-repeat lipoprotein